MKTSFVHQFWSDIAHAAHQLGADGHAPKHLLCGQLMSFGGGQQGGHDHRSRVDGPPLIGVVIIFPVGRCAVDQGGCSHIGAPSMTDDCACPLFHAGLVSGANVIGVPSSHTQTRHIDHQCIAHGLHRGIQIVLVVNKCVG